METNLNQSAYYEESTLKFRESLIDLQAKLDELAKATDLLTSTASIPVKFTSRVKVGELTTAFSGLVKSFLQYQGDLKKALDSETPETPAVVPEAAPEGSPSES